jgi:lipid-A-disaccharide synthase
MKYFIVAGEKSGDLHGSNLVREIFARDKEAGIFCRGGDLMEAEGAKLIMHYRSSAFMGFLEVIKNLKAISRELSSCREHILKVNPDVLILIDYPGFNLRLAAFAKKVGIRVFYYISPKFWAWNENRVKKVRKFVDRMYIIFPFEEQFYRKHDMEVEYRGNPLVDETERRVRSLGTRAETARMLGLNDKPVIALLSGSREQEVKYMLPPMIKIVHRFPRYQFVLAGVNNIPDAIYKRVIGRAPVMLVKERISEVLHVAEASCVASGTATLEAALYNIPQVVCYKSDFFSMLLGWLVVKVKYISLVNLLLNREAVKELLGYTLTPGNLARELGSILKGGDRRDQVLSDYETLRKVLGPSGASARVASDMIDHLTVSRGIQENDKLSRQS